MSSYLVGLVIRYVLGFGLAGAFFGLWMAYGPGRDESGNMRLVIAYGLFFVLTLAAFDVVEAWWRRRRERRGPAEPVDRG